MIRCGLKITENCHVLVDQFHGNFRSEPFVIGKTRYVFRDVKLMHREGLKVNVGLTSDTTGQHSTNATSTSPPSIQDTLK